MSLPAYLPDIPVVREDIARLEASIEMTPCSPDPDVNGSGYPDVAAAWQASGQYIGYHPPLELYDLHSDPESDATWPTIPRTRSSGTNSHAVCVHRWSAPKIRCSRDQCTRPHTPFA